MGCVIEASCLAAADVDSFSNEMLFWVADIWSPLTTQLLACLRARGLCTSPHISSSPDTFADRHPSVDIEDIVRTTLSWILREGKALLTVFPGLSSATTAVSGNASSRFSPPTAPGGRRPQREHRSPPPPQHRERSVSPDGVSSLIGCKSRRPCHHVPRGHLGGQTT